MEKFINILWYLDQLANNPGSKRLQLLSQFASESELFCKVLRAAYSPRVRYFIAEADIHPRNNPVLLRMPKVPLASIFATLDALADRTITGAVAAAEVQVLMTRLLISDQEVFRRILLRDLRCGLGLTTINNVLGANFLPRHQIMKAFEWEASRARWPMFASYKIDCLRCDYYGGVLWSSSGKAFVGVDHIIRDLKALDCQHVTGELLIRNMDFDKASGLLRSKKQCPDAMFWLFDAPEDPSTNLETRIATCHKYIGTYVKVIEHVPVHSLKEVEALYEQALAEGLEGLVIKTPYHPYIGKRSYDWMKLKPKIKMDGVIIDIVEGQGKLIGMMGTVIVRHLSEDRKRFVNTGVGSGWSNDQRQQIFDDREAYLGRHIEFVGMQFTKEGSIRHPRFKRWRADLD